MTEPMLCDLLKENVRIYLACTGAGSGVQNLLWQIPGISSVLIGASFPYAPEATDEFLGFTPDSYCSAGTAVDMAMAAYYRAYKPGGAPALGIGLTASVASLKEHRGDHRAFVASFSEDQCIVYSITLRKGVGASRRAIDGNVCDSLIDIALLEAVGLQPRNQTILLKTLVLGFSKEDGMALARTRFLAHPFFGADGSRGPNVPDATLDRRNHAFFPGSFNPLHEGHLGLRESYLNYTGGSVTFSIEANPPHKEYLSVAEMLRRAKGLKGYNVLFTSGQALYADKAWAYPNQNFIVGVDTLERLLQWGPDVEGVANTFRDTGTSFFVADRKVGGKLQTLEDVTILFPRFQCYRLQGRWDVSSSELRVRGEETPRSPSAELQPSSPP